jgi:L-ascorbate metabolism protein UlaG (beta-lactamase superfamily)
MGILKQHPLLCGSLAVAGGAALTYWLVDRALAAPRYRGLPTDHFDGARFHNLELPRRKGFIGFLCWQLTSRPGYWGERSDSQPGGLPSSRVAGPDLRVTFINHATVLIQMEGINILTDPTWSERASPLSWAGPKRRNLPGIRFEDLPPIDFVLISHNHYDHLDIQTLTRLHTEHRPRFVGGLGNRALFEKHGVRKVTDLDWWESIEVRPGLRIACVPAKHFSGRGFSDVDATLWCGYVVAGPSGSVYFAGDTALGKHFHEIKRRFGPLRLALLPIGAYLPAWFMRPIHLSPADAVEAHRILDAEVSMAIHFGTFPLGDDGEFEPVTKLREALSGKGQGRSPFWVLERGEGRDVPLVKNQVGGFGGDELADAPRGAESK